MKTEKQQLLDMLNRAIVRYEERYGTFGDEIISIDSTVSNSFGAFANVDFCFDTAGELISVRVFTP